VQGAAVGYDDVSEVHARVPRDQPVKLKHLVFHEDRSVIFGFLRALIDGEEANALKRHAFVCHGGRR